MKNRKTSLTSIKDILAELFDDRASPLGGGLFALVRVWEKVAGKAVADHAKPFAFKDGNLQVRVSDPVWQQELTFREPEIRERLNLALGRDTVRKILFRMGR